MEARRGRATRSASSMRSRRGAGWASNISTAQAPTRPCLRFSNASIREFLIPDSTFQVSCMHISLLDVLRCPYCGGRLELVTSMFHRREGDTIRDGILGCHCCIFAVIDGIPVLHLLP